MNFYSDNSDSVGVAEHKDLADVGLPNGNWSIVVNFIEQGNEGNNGLFYAPGPGMPGYGGNAVGPYAYRLISDAVPEPGSLLALGTGLIGMVGFAIRRRR